MFVSIFTDELGLDVTKALPIIRSWGVEHVDFRGRVFRKGIEALDDDELRQLKKLVDDHGMTVGCLQTSLCKVHLPDEERQKQEMEKLEGIIRAADALDCRQYVGLVLHESRARNADVMAAQDLQAAQLVAGVGDAMRRIGAEHVHLLKLPHHRRTVVGDGGADARQYRIVGTQLLLPEIEIRIALLEVNGELEGVEHPGLVPALLRGFPQAPRAVGSRRPGPNR